jgi:hypothetical protein
MGAPGHDLGYTVKFQRHRPSPIILPPPDHVRAS